MPRFSLSREVLVAGEAPHVVPARVAARVVDEAGPGEGGLVVLCLRVRPVLVRREAVLLEMEIAVRAGRAVLGMFLAAMGWTRRRVVGKGREEKERPTSTNGFSSGGA